MSAAAVLPLWRSRVDGRPVVIKMQARVYGLHADRFLSVEAAECGALDAAENILSGSMRSIEIASVERAVLQSFELRGGWW